MTCKMAIHFIRTRNRFYKIVELLGVETFVLVGIAIICIVLLYFIPTIGDTLIGSSLLSIISATIIFLITTTVPRYSSRKQLLKFVACRLDGLMNIAYQIYGCIIQKYNVKNMPTDDEIRAGTKKLDIYKEPNVIKYSEEKLTWTAYLESRKRLITGCIQDIILIGRDDIDKEIVNILDSLNANFPDMQYAFQITHDSGGPIWDYPIIEVADIFRKIEKYRDIMKA